jgi:thiol-disulfide isomerase/thioredoxin
MHGKLLAAAMITVLGFFPLAGCKSSGSSSTSGGPAAKSTGGAAAPEANLAIPNLDGSTTSIDQYKGKVVLVNFWATWCDPCKTEIPWLIELNQKYGPKGLVILGIAMDDEGKKVVDPWVKSKRFEVNGQQEPIDYTILLGNDKIADKFGGVLGLPTSMVYARDGRKVKTKIGLLDFDDMTKTLENQLSEPATSSVSAPAARVLGTEIFSLR